MENLIYLKQGKNTQVPAVEFKNVCLKYAGGGEEALTDINFSVMPGETVGVIGGTGSGKSSLVNMIARFMMQQRAK